MHPYILSDVANDLTHNGVLDTEKYTREGQKWIEAGLAEDNEIIPIAGVDFVMSTNVPLVANLPSSGKSSYATYISADETMFSIALGGFEDVPDESNFSKLKPYDVKVVKEKFPLIDSEAEMPTRRKVKNHRERLSEETSILDDAIVRPCGNSNRKLTLRKQTSISSHRIPLIPAEKLVEQFPITLSSLSPRVQRLVERSCRSVGFSPKPPSRNATLRSGYIPMALAA